MNGWLKRAALAIVLIGFIDVMARIVWAAIWPVAPFLLLLIGAIFLLIGLVKRSRGS